MPDQYVFELQFIGKPDGSDYKENQFVIIDGSSMADFSKLKDDLSMCMPEPFTVQYIDDEDDVISIDTEEEFREFYKIAQKRSSRGMLLRLILNANLPLDHGVRFGQPRRSITHPRTLNSRAVQHNEPPQQSDGSRNHARITISSKSLLKGQKLEEFKEKLKNELKNEILSELKDIEPVPQPAVPARDDKNSEAAAGSSKDHAKEEELKEPLDEKEPLYEEDSDGNMFLVYYPEKIPGKRGSGALQKKVEFCNLQKNKECKYDQRLAKLEMKRKKLMEKYNNKMVLRKSSSVTNEINLPRIYSIIVTKQPAMTSYLVTANTVFTHMWTVVNDGTVTLNNVEIRHTWSTPGLEPEQTSVKIPNLLCGQNATVAVEFKAPDTPNSSWISYWNFFRLLKSGQWVEFSHFVSLQGRTNAAKGTTDGQTTKMTSKIKFIENESSKKPKQDEKEEVTVKEAVDAFERAFLEKCKPTETQEEKIQNGCLSKSIWQKEQLEAKLASSEIAAEMAWKAARLVATATMDGNTTSPSHTALKTSEKDKLNDCALDEAAAAVQKLNLLDSESDTDANVDRGFVMVSMDSEGISEEAGKRIAKEDGKESKEENKVVDNPVAETNTKEDEEVHVLPMFPRLDPNVTYPVFPPPPPRVNNTPLYHLPPSPMVPSNVYNYPVFTPTQSSSSHGIVFPPPVNYSQIPTYPPIPPAMTFPPSVPIQLTTPATTFMPRPAQMASQSNPFTPFNARPANEDLMWGMQYKAPETSNTSSATSTDKPAEIRAQELNTAASAPSKENIQPQPQPQPEVQPQPQLQPQSQPQPRPQPQPHPQPQPAPQPQPQPQLQNPECRNIHSNATEQNQNTEPVQILPQALVDGAITVAATAYSTAWNALNNLRPKDGEASEFDPVFENNMVMLVEMGFNNLERNARLLKRFNNDISQVIGVICSTGGCHNLDID